MKTKKKMTNGVVKHWTPGRLRLFLKPLVGDQTLSKKLQNALTFKKGVTRSRARPSPGSLVIWYDLSKISDDRILEELDQFLKEFFQRPHENNNLPLANNFKRSSMMKKVGLHLMSAAILGCFLIYSLYRRFFGAPLSQRAYSTAGAIAIFSAAPLLFQAIKERKRKKRAGLLIFLTGACGLAIFTGQALTAIEIIWLLSLGNLLEKYASEKAGRAVKESIEITPEHTFLVVKGEEVEILVADLTPGDVVTAYLGDKISADGVVVKGEALVDESRITGRWEPTHRSAGDSVYAGSKIVQGSLHVQAEKTGDKTYLRRITHMVEQSLENRTESERAADELARRLTKIGALSTAATFLVTGSLPRSLSVLLVMACPCAAVLAASTAVAAAIANAARHHILVKDGRFLEKAGDVDTYCFDKTGTVTTDMPELADIATRTPNQNPDAILGLAASVEINSRHPAAKALLNAAAARQIELSESSSHEEFPGRGVSAAIEEDAILVGNLDFMESREVNCSYFKNKSKNFQDAGKTVLYVARNGKPQGIIALENTIRPGAEAVLHRIRRYGVDEIHLISGDYESVVSQICEALKFDACKAEMLPEEKAAYVESLVDYGHSVLMVGDGINDALALSKADVGGAMGAGGSDTVLETADVAFLTNDLNSVAALRQLSVKTRKTVELNFRIALITDILGILLGAAGFLAPGASGILHLTHTLGIFYNSGRLLKN